MNRQSVLQGHASGIGDVRMEAALGLAMAWQYAKCGLLDGFHGRPLSAQL